MGQFDVKLFNTYAQTWAHYEQNKFKSMSGKMLNYITPKGQLNSEWIYEVIVSPKMPTKNYQDFCPTL